MTHDLCQEELWQGGGGKSLHYLDEFYDLGHIILAREIALDNHTTVSFNFVLPFFFLKSLHRIERISLSICQQHLPPPSSFWEGMLKYGRER